MRKIIFDSNMVVRLRKMLEDEGRTVKYAANQFGVSEDTIRRVRYENNIRSSKTLKPDYDYAVHKISEERIKEVIALYKCTDARMADICREVKLENYVVQSILADNFSEEYRNRRKSRLYRESKLGSKNPMTGKTGPETPQWKGGVVSDGQGYLMVKKPEWYTGRKGSDYIFQHTEVVCRALGLAEMPKGFAVHHIDHNPLNNDISNLALVSMGAHSKLHAIEKRMMTQGSETIRKGVGEDGPETPDLDRLGHT